MLETLPTVKAKETEIPALGFGTFQLENDTAEDMVREALLMGYRHVDTAQIYGNESGVGRGMKGSGIDRDKVFLTTKVWIDRFEPAELEASVEESLRKLDTDYVNLLLLHWPNDEVPLEKTMEALMAQREKGRTLAIGVSNFTTRHLQKAIELSADTLLTNQVEYHPFLDQTAVLAMLRENNMALTAYSPLARGKVLAHPLFQEIAAKHQASPTQVSLAWLLAQPGVVAIPKCSWVKHATDNLKCLELELTSDELAQLDALRSPEGRLIDPDFAPEWD